MLSLPRAQVPSLVGELDPTSHAGVAKKKSNSNVHLWMLDKPGVVCPCRGIRFSLKQQGPSNTCCSVDGLGDTMFGREASRKDKRLH